MTDLYTQDLKAPSFDFLTRKMGLASLCVLMRALVLGMVQTLPALLPSVVSTVQYSCLVNEEAVSGIQTCELLCSWGSSSTPWTVI